MKAFVSALMAMLLWGAFTTSATEAAKKADCTPAFPGAFECQVTVDQGWDSKKQQEFWFTGQGSNIIPYSWFLKLEKANSAKLFRSPDNIDSYRYLPQGKSDMNPDGLPIGFTMDDTKGSELYGKMSRKWLGLTCAACHTGQLEYGDRKVLIDGAPAMADFQTFFEDMATAMRATLNNPAKFKRFAAAIKNYNDEKNTGDFSDEDTLLEYLDKMTVILETRNVRNSGSIRFGNSRLDALGSILNQIRLAAGKDIAEGRVDAPVSYPFIWDTPQHDRVQWNGSVHNAGTGAMRRNVGEVIGVFGAIDLNSHQSSINVTQLGQLEQLIWELQSPRWEEVWKNTDESKIDTSLADVGGRIYAKRCKSCHALPIDRSNRESEITAVMVPLNVVKTDNKMARNFLSPDLLLLGGSVKGVIKHELKEDKIATLKTIKAGQPTAVVEIINAIAKKHLKGSVNRDQIDAFFTEMESKLEKPKSRCHVNPLKLCYKARPLNGVWATAPYLHNGSVRTIRQLLVPSERQEEFNVGSREYDPKNMGFKDAGNFVMNTTLQGNLNTGHDYYGSYFEVYRGSLRALMEYLKTL